MKVGTVVFDLGKVLVDFDYGMAASRLAEKSTVTADQVRKVIDQSPLLYRYEGAQMTTQAFFDEVRKAIGFSAGFDEFAAAFADIFTEIPSMTRLHAELRAAGIPSFILSNTNDIAVSHIRRRFPFFREFTGYVLSYEHGVLKPEDRIYEITEAKTGRRGEEILFIDDRAENVESAARRGWQTLWHRTPEESTATVRQLLADQLA